jgi:type I restriction enzyme M protein
MLIDARLQFEKEPKALAEKRNRMTDAHRQWIETRYHDGWAEGYADGHVKIFRREDFAYHKVSVVFWQTDESDKPAIVTDPYEKAFTAANVAKELEFYDSEIIFRVRQQVGETEQSVELALKPGDNVAKKFKAVFDTRPEILSVEWTHRHYIQDDEYITYGQNIDEFLKREIDKPIIRWEDTKKNGRPILGYEILPNKYFYKYDAPTPANDLLAEFWRLERETEKMLGELADQ